MGLVSYFKVKSILLPITEVNYLKEKGKEMISNRHIHEARGEKYECYDKRKRKMAPSTLGTFVASQQETKESEIDSLVKESGLEDMIASEKILKLHNLESATISIALYKKVIEIVNSSNDPLDELVDYLKGDHPSYPRVILAVAMYVATGEVLAELKNFKDFLGSISSLKWKEREAKKADYLNSWRSATAQEREDIINLSWTPLKEESYLSEEDIEDLENEKMDEMLSSLGLSFDSFVELEDGTFVSGDTKIEYSEEGFGFSIKKGGE